MRRILCYGDSNTWGHHPMPDGTVTRYEDEVRWTGVLQECLRGKFRVIEEGLCGRTVMFDDPVAPDRNGRTFLNCCLQSHQPLDLVILMLGTNDIRHIFTPSVMEIGLGMQTLVKMAQNPELFGAGHVPKVLVITPAPVREEIRTSDFYGMYDEESVRKSRLLDQEYHRALKGMKGVYFLNAGEIAEVSKRDCIHFTEEGHAALGKAVAEKVRELFQ